MMDEWDVAVGDEGSGYVGQRRRHRATIVSKGRRNLCGNNGVRAMMSLSSSSETVDMSDRKVFNRAVGHDNSNGGTGVGGAFGAGDMMFEMDIAVGVEGGGIGRRGQHRATIVSKSGGTSAATTGPGPHGCRRRHLRTAIRRIDSCIDCECCCVPFFHIGEICHIMGVV